MRFVIHPEIFHAFPGLRIAVAVARGLDNRSERPKIAARLRAAWAGAAAAAVHGNAQSHPRVRPWREGLRGVGASPKEFQSSIEALLRRALRGGEPFRVNPLVDFYHAISLRHVVPAGGFDLGRLQGPLELRLTRPGDTFHALDAAEATPLPPGEVAYADGSTVLTRHFVWRQAREGLIHGETRDVVLLAEVLGGLGDGVAEAVEADFRQGLLECFAPGGLRHGDPRCGAARLPRSGPLTPSPRRRQWEAA